MTAPPPLPPLALRRLLSAGVAAMLLAGCGSGDAGPDFVEVAAAANLADVQESLVRDFETRAGHRVRVSLGSTGQLAAQIASGAPYEVFLAADAVRPRELVEQGLAVPASRRVYALGRLALWAPAYTDLPDPPWSLLEREEVRVAIANPRIAPYGEAALAVLDALGLRDVVADRLVYGESIAQAYQFVASGGAEVGFVAASQLRRTPGGSWSPVPPDLHPPIVQEVVLLRSAQDDPGARAFVAYLEGPHAARILEAAGYATPGGGP